MRNRLRTELVALFGRDLVDRAKAEQPAIDLLMAQSVHQAAHELLQAGGQPVRQRKLAAQYPESVRLALSGMYRTTRSVPPSRCTAIVSASLGRWSCVSIVSGRSPACASASSRRPRSWPRRQVTEMQALPSGIPCHLAPLLLHL